MTNRITVDLNLTGEQAMSRGFDRAGDSAQNFGDDLKGSAAQAGFLDKRIQELRGSTKELAAEFARAGDKDIFKQLRGANRELGQLEKLKKDFFDVGADVGVKAGATVGTKFGEGFTGSLMALRGPMIGVLVGAAALATPFLSGVISSAIIGGVGAGGIVGGIALAAQDARVQDSWKAFSEGASSAFKFAGEPFVQPVVEALAVLDREAGGIAGSLRDAFKEVAPTLVPLTQGLAGLVRELMPGLTSALSSARPLLLVIAGELPKIGRALSTFFRSISDDPRGAMLAFQDLTTILSGTIIMTGRFLQLMSAVWQKLSPMFRIASGDLQGFAYAVAGVSPELTKANELGGQLTDGLADLADSATEAKQKLISLNDALDRFFGIAMNSSQATIAFERAWDEMIDTLTDGKRTLDLSTEAGRENMESINATIQGIQGMHKARVDEGMQIQDSLVIRDRELEKLRAQLLQLGYNAKQINDIIDLYKLMPELASTTVEAPGAETTIAQLRELLSLINAIQGGTMLGALGGARVGRRAGGGPVSPNQTYLVGENGPELLHTGSTSGHVTNATQTAAMMSGASGGTVVQANFNVQPTGRALEDLLVELLASRLRLTGGVIGKFKIPRLAG